MDILGVVFVGHRATYLTGQLYQTRENVVVSSRYGVRGDTFAEKESLTGLHKLVSIFTIPRCHHSTGSQGYKGSRLGMVRDVVFIPVIR